MNSFIKFTKYDADISCCGIFDDYDDGTRIMEGSYYLSVYKNVDDAVAHVISTNLHASTVSSIYKKVLYKDAGLMKI